MLIAKKFVLNAICYFILTNLLSVHLLAQSGNVSGTVTDSSRHAVLVGAQVQVEGQALRTSTDASGRFLLLGVPAGTVKVTVSYLGFDPLTREVTVSGGVTGQLDFALSLPKVLVEVTVTDSPGLAGQARALNDQMNSINLV